MGFLIFALVVTGGIFLYIKADDGRINEMNDAQTTLAVALANRLRRQVLGEQIHALDDAALTQSLARFLQLRAKHFPSPELALQSQKVLQAFPVCLARVAEGDVVTLKSLMGSIRIETLGNFAAVADQCHRVLLERSAQKRPEDAVMTEAYKAMQDAIAEAATLIRGQEISLPALDNIKTAIPLLSMAVFRFQLRKAADEKPELAGLYEQFEAYLQKGNPQAFNEVWPRLQAALQTDAHKERSGEFSNALEQQFAQLLNASGVAGAAVGETLAAQIAIAAKRVTQDAVKAATSRHLQPALA